MQGRLKLFLDLRDLGEDKETTSYLEQVLRTQMFQRFLEERMENPGQTEIRFFDEAIVAKLNRSKVKKMAKGGKVPTPFLDDDSGKVRQGNTLRGEYSLIFLISCSFL